jgi:hypothetical protein
VKRRIESNTAAVIVCEQCAMLGTPPLHAEARRAESIEDSPTFAALAEKEASARIEYAGFANLPDEPRAQTAYRRWAHISTSKARHRQKSHANDPQGRK